MRLADGRYAESVSLKSAHEDLGQHTETVPAVPAVGQPASAPDTGPCSCRPGRAHCSDV